MTQRQPAFPLIKTLIADFNHVRHALIPFQKKKQASRVLLGIWSDGSPKKSSACLQSSGLSSFTRRSDLFQQGRRGTTDLNKQLWVIRAGKANAIHKFWMAPTEVHRSAVKWENTHDETENLPVINKYWIWCKTGTIWTNKKKKSCHVFCVRNTDSVINQFTSSIWCFLIFAGDISPLYLFSSVGPKKAGNARKEMKVMLFYREAPVSIRHRKRKRNHMWHLSHNRLWFTWHFDCAKAHQVKWKSVNSDWTKWKNRHLVWKHINKPLQTNHSPPQRKKQPWAESLLKTFV